MAGLGAWGTVPRAYVPESGTRRLLGLSLEGSSKVKLPMAHPQAPIAPQELFWVSVIHLEDRKQAPLGIPQDIS